MFKGFCRDRGSAVETRPRGRQGERELETGRHTGKWYQLCCREAKSDGEAGVEYERHKRRGKK